MKEGSRMNTINNEKNSEINTTIMKIIVVAGEK
jgi:hypothetical protein